MMPILAEAVTWPEAFMFVGFALAFVLYAWISRDKD